jgi:hypothetical protein
VDLATACLNLMGHHTGNGGEVDDSFLGYTKSGQSDGVRLKFANLFVAEQLQAFKTISSAALQQGMQARHFVLLCRQHDLPAQFMGNIVLCTEVNHSLNALHRQASLRRTGLIVQAAMQNTAIVASLMATGTTFLLQEKQPGGRKSLEQLMRRRQSDNSTTDDSNCFAHLLIVFQQQAYRSALHHSDMYSGRLITEPLVHIRCGVLHEVALYYIWSCI